MHGQILQYAHRKDNGKELSVRLTDDTLERSVLWVT